MKGCCIRVVLSGLGEDMAGAKYLVGPDKAAINDFMTALVERMTGEIPPVLWHYTTAEGLLGILDSKKIRASHISTMNDVYEYRYSVGSLVQAAEHRLKLDIDDVSRSMLGHLCAELKDLRIDRVPPVFVSCFTSNVDWTNHWGEYGDRGRGYALGFSTPELFQVAALQAVFFQRCVYDNKTVAALMAEIVLTAERIFKGVQARNSGVAIGELANDFLQFYTWNLGFVAPAFKGPTFAHEAEWRATLQLPEYDYSRMTFVARKSEIRPYIELDLVRDKQKSWPQTPLLEVVIGPARHEVDKEIALISVRAFLDKLGYNATKVSHSRSSYRGA